MKRLLPLLAVLLSCTECYDSAGTPPDTPPVLPVPNNTLTELRRLYAGRTFEITSDIIVAGRVTSDDRGGNFYRTLTFEEGGAAAELMAGTDGLHNTCPPGCRIIVKLKGLAVGESRGVLQIGCLPAPGSGYATDFIPSRPALDACLFCDGTQTPLRPFITDILSLRPEMAGRFVRIDGLRFSPEEVEPAEWAGTKRFADSEGNFLYTYTRPYADFADDEIPDREVLLAGILQCDAANDGAFRYTLRLRDAADCWY